MSLPFRRNLSEAAQLARRQWDSASAVGASHLTSSRLTSAGCNPFSVFFVSFLFWLCVFGLSVCCFCFLFMPCFSGFVLFSCWDCFWTAYWSTTGTFVAFNKWTALHLFFSLTAGRRSAEKGSRQETRNRARGTERVVVYREWPADFPGVYAPTGTN